MPIYLNIKIASLGKNYNNNSNEEIEKRYLDN